MMSETVFNVMNLVVGVALAVALAWMVRAAGRAMLGEAFPHNGALTRVVTRAAMASFSLICAGYLVIVSGLFWTQANPGFVWDQATKRLELASLGWTAVLMGVNFFFHLLVLSQIRGRGRRRPRDDEHDGESILA